MGPIELNKRGILSIALPGLVALILAGCAMPPDLVNLPHPGPPPAVERDSSVADIPPIESKMLEEALQGIPMAVMLEIGDDALLARIHLIRGARKSIDIQMFIYKYDRTGFWFYSELLKAARRGVKVRLLVDHIISPGITAEEYAALATAHENLEIRLFRPISRDAVYSGTDITQSTLMRFSSMNYRMHNKVMLVDDMLAIVGGRNIQDAYYDRDPEMSFLDRDVIVGGPVCAEIGDSFESFWTFKETYDATCMGDVRKVLKNGKPTLPREVLESPAPTFSEIDQLANLGDLSLVRPGLKIMEVEQVDFIADAPVKVSRFTNPWKQNPFEEIYAIMEQANEEILLQTPYAVTENRTYERLRKIRNKKPEVRFKLSTNSLASVDHYYVGSIALKQRRFHIEGLKIQLYLAKPVPGDIGTMAPMYNLLLQQAGSTPDENVSNDEDGLMDSRKTTRFCVHGKSMVIDRKVSLVGSHNFDPRSVYLNSECLVIIRDANFSRELGDLLDRFMHPNNSWVVARRNLPRVIGDLNGLMTLISSNLPMFDMWPIEHVSCFELRDGFEPLSPEHEDFHMHYQDVGPIPGLEIGLEPVRVQLIRAFGGAMAPLM